VKILPIIRKSNANVPVTGRKVCAASAHQKPCIHPVPADPSGIIGLEGVFEIFLSSQSDTENNHQPIGLYHAVDLDEATGPPTLNLDQRDNGICFGHGLPIR
jgi:hypothetical protein